jgi:hypothetical protein
LFQPEMRSLADGATPSPLVNAFVKHCIQHQRGGVTRAAS